MPGSALKRLIWIVVLLGAVIPPDTKNALTSR